MRMLNDRFIRAALIYTMKSKQGDGGIFFDELDYIFQRKSRLARSQISKLYALIKDWGLCFAAHKEIKVNQVSITMLGSVDFSS